MFEREGEDGNGCLFKAEPKQFSEAMTDDKFDIRPADGKLADFLEVSIREVWSEAERWF